ncbi:MAG: hypothetical protein NT160_01420 [Actinobacteria bacterium]|nr:hypothetical protein [Actinomycetota bacterium]
MAIQQRSAVNVNDGLGLLLRDLDYYPMPSYEEQVDLAKRVTAGDEEAKQQMVAANLRLVIHHLCNLVDPPSSPAGGSAARSHHSHSS